MNIFLFIIFYILSSFTIVGYGQFTKSVILTKQNNINEIGFIGLLGFLFLYFISSIIIFISNINNYISLFYLCPALRISFKEFLTEPKR